MMIFPMNLFPFGREKCGGDAAAFDQAPGFFRPLSIGPARARGLARPSARAAAAC